MDKTGPNEVKTSPLEWLRKYWFLVAFAVASTAAWSDALKDIDSLKEDVKDGKLVNERVQDLRVEQAQLVERTKSIQSSQEQTQNLLQQLLRETKRRAGP